MVPRLVQLSAFCLVTASCYAAELNPDVSAVFVCESESDCALGQTCGDDGLCLDVSDLAGPEIELMDPQPLFVYDQAQGSVPISVRGKNFELTNDPAAAPRTGYIEVYFDGILIDAVTDGDLEGGINLQALPVPDEPGLHHIVLSARNLDGERFDNPESEAQVGFWVDDGNEHVGILSPAPGTRLALDGEEVHLEVAALNFTFVNPGFMAPTELTRTLEGYVHLYVDADVPSCLPSCNFDYQSSIIPRGLARVNHLTSEQGLLLPDGVGTVRLQIVAQTTSNAPYYRDLEEQELVYHEVPVQSVLGLNP